MEQGGISGPGEQQPLLLGGFSQLVLGSWLIGR